MLTFTGHKTIPTQRSRALNLSPGCSLEPELPSPFLVKCLHVMKRKEKILCENEVCLCKPLGVLSLQWYVNCTPERVVTVSVANYKKTTLVCIVFISVIISVCWTADNLLTNEYNIQ